MLNFVKAIKKIAKRKKRNGYYEASEILTVEEKNSLIIFSISIFIPLIVSISLILINK